MVVLVRNCGAFDFGGCPVTYIYSEKTGKCSKSKPFVRWNQILGWALCNYRTVLSDPQFSYLSNGANGKYLPGGPKD